jgi:hypothetical protein
MKQVAIRAVLATRFVLILEIEATCSCETSIAFNMLHGVIFQEIGLFTTTAVRTSNPTLRGSVEI